ncbi:hypothetical protein HF1_01490 [Mycoplasma haemofelis str. Langford 1]|uniref:Uncharacterized protein n=1 Tax=Mycoplasma haemofelis (strain Langford 1) TaxID=941640 RepID=E8ZKJ1_MYCHL|nr:hypothetical protein HF1_01490 [Mycoplasma haemofelis str. Langford 1]
MAVTTKSSLLLGGIGVGGIGAWGGYKLMTAPQESIHSLVTKNGEHYLLSTSSSADDSTWEKIISSKGSQIKKATGLSEVQKKTLKEWCSKEKDFPPSRSYSLQNYKDFCTQFTIKGKAKSDNLQVIEEDDKDEWNTKNSSYTTQAKSPNNTLTLKVGSGAGEDKSFSDFESVKAWCKGEWGMGKYVCRN